MRSIKFILFVVALLFQGCAASNKLSGSALPEKVEEIKPVVIKEFVLGCGDTIEITVWKHEELNKKILIGPGGSISYPFMGEIQAKGMTIHKLKDHITKALSKYFVDPVVSVNITSNKSQKIFVLGEVSTPGIFNIPGPTFALEAISMAGGFTLDANEENVFLVRKGNIESQEPTMLNLMASLEDGDLSQNINLQPGDVLYVPATAIANVDRFFKRIYNVILPLVTLEYGIALEPAVEEAVTGKAQKAGGKNTNLNLRLLP